MARHHVPEGRKDATSLLSFHSAHLTTHHRGNLIKPTTTNPLSTPHPRDYAAMHGVPGRGLGPLHHYGDPIRAWNFCCLLTGLAGLGREKPHK